MPRSFMESEVHNEILLSQSKKTKTFRQTNVEIEKVLQVFLFSLHPRIGSISSSSSLARAASSHLKKFSNLDAL